MDVLIVGSGLLGRAVAERLDSLGHGVVVVDESAENLELLPRDFGGVTFAGFPMDLNVLRRAGIGSCDAVAVTTGDDNLNIAVGQIAKRLFKVERVAARVADPEREDIFDVDVSTVCTTNMACDKLVTELLSPRENKQVNFGNATVALELRPVERRYFGQSTNNVDLPGCGIFAVIRPDGEFVLKETAGGIALSEGDVMVISRRID